MNLLALIEPTIRNNSVQETIITSMKLNSIIGIIIVFIFVITIKALLNETKNSTN